MHIDPWILAFSALTVLATIWVGFWSARRSRTAHDFYVAGRSVSVGWNASAISGEYLSAASFMGVAGMVMSSGYDALWYPVCYACGYLFLLLFIAGPLRRFGAYTIPDFAEGRFDSPLFRKIAVVFVLFIGFFYTMPQMKGAGTTLAYIFPGLPYWAGVVLVGAVITLNVALGGMKGITLVQAFQYWAKMFAISVPIFVLMSVYGHYGKQVEVNDPAKLARNTGPTSPMSIGYWKFSLPRSQRNRTPQITDFVGWINFAKRKLADRRSKGLLEPSSQLTVQFTGADLDQVLQIYSELKNRTVLKFSIEYPRARYDCKSQLMRADQAALFIESLLRTNGVHFIPYDDSLLIAATVGWTNKLAIHLADFGLYHASRKLLPDKAPKDQTWLSPFGPLTTKAAKATVAAMTNQPAAALIPLRAGLSPTERMTANLSPTNVSQALAMYADLTGRQLLPRTNSTLDKLDEMLNHRLSRWQLVKPAPAPDTGVSVHRDGYFTAGEVKTALEEFFRTNGVALLPEGEKYFRAVAAEVTRLTSNGKDQSLLTSAATDAQKAWLAKHEKPLALLYTYSLIIALVCGTAGLPHILVRFYTNPDGVAAKRTTMWVMILIGVFYLFPPVFGVMGRNLMPELYNSLSGVKGTDGVVLRLPTILNERFGMLGSILSGITCAGAFAAFMSTFSGLLVSITGALAHDIYGRILRPHSTPNERTWMFKVSAVICGGAAMLLGFLVEKFEINKMVGWAFAIAATSYFPLLFLSTWWRGITMKGASIGMLVGGTFSLIAIASTMFADQAKWAEPLKHWYAGHPLFRILAEQPAIWALPLAMALMILISRLTRREVPPDVRMKMLVLHAPEKLGLKQEYIQEHQQGH